MNNRKPTPKPSVLRGKAAIDAYKKQISPAGVAAAEAAAKAALEKKYPGMFIPNVRKTPGVGKR